MDLISFKLENEMINFNILRKPAIKNINRYISTNFEKIIKKQNRLLNYMACMAIRDSKILSRERTNVLIQINLKILEESHQEMKLKSVLTKITNLGFLTSNIKVLKFLRDREEEIKEIQSGNLFRIAKNCSYSNQSQIVRAYVIRFISNELILRLPEEKIYNRMKLLGVFCKLENIDPYLGISGKINFIVNNLRKILKENNIHNSNPSYEIQEKLSPVLLQNFLEALVYYKDTEKKYLIREICEQFASLCEKNDPLMKKISILRFIECLAKFKFEEENFEDFKIISEENLKIILNSYLDNEEIITYSKNFIGIFTIFQAVNFQDKVIIEKCFELCLKNLKYFPVYKNLINFKNFSQKNLPESIYSKAKKIIEENSLEIFEEGESAFINQVILLNTITRLNLFDCDKDIKQRVLIKILEFLKMQRNPITEKDAKNTYGNNRVNFNIEDIKRQRISIMTRFMENYICNVQKFLAGEERILIVKEILEFFEEFSPDKNSLFFLLSELIIDDPQENEGLKAFGEINNDYKDLKISEFPDRINSLISKLKVDNGFYHYYLKFFDAETNENSSGKSLIITNKSFEILIKYLEGFLLEDVRDFYKGREKLILILFITSANNLIKFNSYYKDKDSYFSKISVSNDLIEKYLNLADEISLKSEGNLPNISYIRFAQYLKEFKKEKIQSKLFEKLALECLKELIDKNNFKLTKEKLILLKEISENLTLEENEENNQRLKIIGNFLGENEAENKKIFEENKYLRKEILNFYIYLNGISKDFVSDDVIEYGNEYFERK